MATVYGKSSYINKDRSKVWRENVIAIDGEGRGVDELGRQYYKLLVAADVNGLSWYIYREHGVTAAEAFEWLYQLPYAHYTSFSFTYDATQLLRTIPDEDVQRLLCEKDRRGTYVNWDKWQMDWRMGKYFRIKRRGGRYPFTIWDAYPYYQMSLIEAINESDLPDDGRLKIIANGKARRGVEDMPFNVAVELEYAVAECVMLARMQQELFRNIETLGINLNAFYGPGGVAEAVMRKEGVPEYLAPIDEQWAQAAKTAYAGGRFETIGHGYLKQLWEYDINSAYPAALLRVPCLAHCTWTHTQEPGDTSLVHVRWRLREGLWGPFPVHNSNGLAFPFNGETWVWGWEFKAAHKYLKCDLTVLECVSPVSECGHRPFQFVDRAYKARKTLEAKKNNGLAKVYKLWLNSLYGKTAQSIGHPTFASDVWAGMVTSWTRAQLLSVIGTGEVVSTATDGLMTRTPISYMRQSERLGGWGKFKVFNNVLIMQPGVWHAEEKSRTRGCNKSAMDWQKAREVFCNLSSSRADSHTIASTHIPVPDHNQFVTLTQANAEGDLSKAGVWRRGNHRFRYYSTKRPVVEWRDDDWFDSYPRG